MSRTASALNHPHICTILDYGDVNGSVYIVMPYLTGGSLADLIARSGPQSIQDLVPKHLNGQSSLQNFQQKKQDLDPIFLNLKRGLKHDEVIRHVGELNLKTGQLEVKLAKEKKTSALGSLQNADSSFEIFTESYGEQPLVIRGAGAGAAVTARGLVCDILKLSERL